MVPLSFWYSVLLLVVLFPVTHNQAQGLMIKSFGSTGAWPPCHQQEDKVESDNGRNELLHDCRSDTRPTGYISG